jgi:hypothetical protein
MRRGLATIVISGCVFVGLASGQAVPAESAITSTSTSSSTSASSSVLTRSASASTETIASRADGSDIALDPASLLPDLPSLPRGNASLVGGNIQRLDRVRDQITVQVFGGGKMKISFDTRTHIYHDGTVASASDLRQGDRVYVDTILDGPTVFARSIRLKTATSAGESQGTVMSYRADKGELEIRDLLSPKPLKIRITAETRLVNGAGAASASELAAGTLVAVKFNAQNGGDVAREVSVLAVPGASFTFAGRVTAIDLRLGLLVLTSSTDGKTYEIHLDSPDVKVDDSLRPAADVTVLARFDGNRYVARSVTVNARQ